MAKAGAQTRPKRGWRKLLLFLIGLLFGGLALGFVLYTNHIENLSIPDVIPEADGIVVFTGGGGGRLDMAGALLKEGRGERVFVSGVNPSLDAPAVGKLMGVSEPLSECCIDLDYVALDTRGNAQETVQWVEALGYDHVLLVTSTYHMPRAKIELLQAMPGLRVTPVPVRTGRLAKWWEHHDQFRLLSSEYGKYLLVLARGRGDKEVEREPMLPEAGLAGDPMGGE